MVTKSRIALAVVAAALLPILAVAQSGGDSGSAATRPAETSPAAGAAPAAPKPSAGAAEDAPAVFRAGDAPKANSSPPASMPTTSRFTGEVSGTGGTGPHGISPIPPMGPRGRFEGFYLPEIDLPPTTWFAIVIILTLTLSSRPMGTLRSLDGFMLAVSGALLALRGETSYLAGGVSTQVVVYALFSLIAVYWMYRGWQLVQANSIPRSESNVTEGPLLVLAIAAIAIAGATIANAPLSRSSQDAMVGGVHMVENGKLPHGTTIGYDGRAPLVYVLHAGAIRATQALMEIGEPGELRGPTVTLPTVDVADGMAPLTWNQRSRWGGLNWWDHGTLQAARLVNAALFLLTLLAVNVIGRRLHSPAMGLTMVAIFSVFPGTTEVLNRPDVMLPLMLLSWTVACALLPSIGGFLSVFLLVLAGTAWPWAWLGLPALLAFLLRRGSSQGVGGLLALAAGIVAVAVGLNTLVEPGIPRANGALRAAGFAPRLSAKLDGKKVYIESVPAGTAATNFKSSIWQFLLSDDDVKLSPAAAATGGVTLAEGVDPQSVSFAQMDVADPASDALLPLYQEAAGSSFRAKLRTVLEAVWLPARNDDTLPPTPWSVWMGDNEDLAGIVRPIVKVIAALLALWMAFVIYSRRLTLPQHLIGAMLVVSAFMQLATDSGAASELAWLAVLASMLLAVNGATAAEPASGAALASVGKSPRITVEK